MPTSYVFSRNVKKYQNLLSENFHFLVVKFSVYFNRHVFVMSKLDMFVPVCNNGCVQIQRCIFEFGHDHCCKQGQTCPVGCNNFRGIFRRQSEAVNNTVNFCYTVI